MTDAPRTKITYATLRADNEELHAAFEAAVVAARARLGGGHPNIIGGRERAGSGMLPGRCVCQRGGGVPDRPGVGG